MHLIDLFEAPIANIYTHGDFDHPGSFRADDLSLATAKRQEKIKRVLQKAPIEIDLHFFNQAHPIRANGQFDIRFYLATAPERLGHYLTPEQVTKWWLPIIPKPNALNLVLVNNEGDARLPMTPWIIAHRLSHAFQYAEPFLHRDAWSAFQTMLDKVMDDYDLPWFSSHSLRSSHTLAPIFGTTRAAREGMIEKGRAGEWFHDCFAQLCITGDIRFNPAPDDIKGHRGDASWVDRQFTKLRQILLDTFREMLTNSVGKILVF